MDDLATVKLWLHQGCCDKQRTLVRAAHEHRVDIVAALLNAGASVNVRDADGLIPLKEAIVGGCATIVDMFLDRGARIDNSCLYLHFAVEHARSRDIVASLVKHGADLDTFNFNGHTALTVACFRNHRSIVSLLTRHGATIQDVCFSRDPSLVIQHNLIHWKLVGIVMALAPLDLPGYVLLWICDWLPYFATVATEYYKITLITRVVNSIRRVKKPRKK